MRRLCFRILWVLLNTSIANFYSSAAQTGARVELPLITIFIVELFRVFTWI